MSIESKIRPLGANPSNYGSGRATSEIKYLVYHYTGNDGDTAAANAQYYREALVKSSAHYFVDDKEVVQSVSDSYIAWAVGGKKWSDCDKTGGGKLYGVVTNANSISIEMCDVARDGRLMASEATLANAAELGRMLMKRYNIPIDHVVRHFDVTGKYCPAYFMDESAWAAFKSRLSDSEQTGKENGSMERRYQTFYEIQKAAPWAAATVQKLMDKGALNGTGTGLDLSADMLRLLVIAERAFGK